MALNQYKTPLFDAMKKYAEDQVIPFHVPGHKQGHGLSEFKDYFGENVLKTDVNGMDGLDYYNNPSGVILEAEELLAEAYGADNAFFLVNGTSSGVHVMILSACLPGTEIILPRNAHKSTIGGLILSGAVPVYVQPEFNDDLGIAMGVSNETIKTALEAHPQASAVFIINPNYYGVTSNLKRIVQEAHDKGISVLVDEAHGAHMRFHPEFPLSSMAAGADISAVSIHKTAGSMTQSSALLIGQQCSKKRVKQSLDLISTSSASYILMCSLDIARKQLSVNGKELLEEALQLARWARNEINKIEGLYAFGKELIGTPGCFDFDETKLGINVSRLGRTGYEIESILRKKYNIQIEMSDLSNILAIISLGDCKKNLQCLIDALKDIAKNSDVKKVQKKTLMTFLPETIITPRAAFYSEKRSVSLDKSIGEVAGEMIMAYPPGIPVLGIGERISKASIDYIKILKKEKCQLQGAADPQLDTITIISKASND